MFFSTYPCSECSDFSRRTSLQILPESFYASFTPDVALRSVKFTQTSLCRNSLRVLCTDAALSSPLLPPKHAVHASLRENQTCTNLRATISHRLLAPLSLWGKTMHRKWGNSSMGRWPFPLGEEGGGQRRHEPVITIW